MKFHILVIFIFLWPFPSQLIHAQTSNSVEGDRQALVDLYNATDGDAWTNNSGWLQGDPSNDWYGIEVNANGRVIQVDLNSNNLSGFLPETIGNLSQVTYFDIEQNAITGEIPSSIGNMASLRELWLAGNPDVKPDFSDGGYHPGKSDKTNNKFTGQIPTSIGNLTNLEILRLERQGGMTGPIPSEIGNATSLRALLLWGEYKYGEPGGFTGKMPSSIGNLTDLVFLNFGRHGIEGALPVEMGNLVNLKDLRFGGAKVTSFPDSFANLTKLVRFDAMELWLDMPFPKYFWNGSFTELNTWRADWPHHPDGTSAPAGFSGDISDIDWSTTPKMVSFGIAGHINLTGTISESITTWNAKIVNIAWSDRDYVSGFPDTEGITGVVPQTGWADWTKLRNLRLNDNNLSGAIPTEITQMEGNLLTVDFSRNRYVFKDIMPVLEAGSIQNFEFDNQRPFGEAATVTHSAGQTFTFDYSHKSHPDDRYQWTKDGNPITGQTSARITIDNVDAGDEGVYRLEMTNPNLPELGTLISRPIELKLNQ